MFHNFSVGCRRARVSKYATVSKYTEVIRWLHEGQFRQRWVGISQAETPDVIVSQ